MQAAEYLYLNVIGERDFILHPVGRQKNSAMFEKTLSQTERIVSECDLKQDGILLYQEIVTCWQLIMTDEYVLYSLLHDNSATLDVYGTCGTMYAVEFADSEPFLGLKTSLSDHRSWERRADMAVALLELVEALESTAYGTLYLCDVQESNFGLVSDVISGDISTSQCMQEISIHIHFKHSCTDFRVSQPEKQCIHTLNRACQLN